MKLKLALSVVLHCDDKKFQDKIGGAACQLPWFISDSQAQRLDAIRKDCRDTRKRNESLSMEQDRSYGEVTHFMIEAMDAGSRLWADLVDFVASVKRIDANDALYWQKVFT